MPIQLTHSGVGGADLRPPRVYRLTTPLGRSLDAGDEDETEDPSGLLARCRHIHHDNN